MTITLGSNHDKHYTCPCGQKPRGIPSPVNVHNWTCNTCHQPVTVFMDDHSGNTFTVHRRLSKDVQVGDTVVHPNNRQLDAHAVGTSSPYGNKGVEWYLFLRGHGPAVLQILDFVNVELKP